MIDHKKDGNYHFIKVSDESLIFLLSLELKECIKLWIKKVLLTFDKENIDSSKTIINNGVVLENEVRDNDRIT